MLIFDASILVDQRLPWKSTGAFWIQNGWSGGGTTEPTPLTARLVYSERWAKKKIDPLELVTLRESGLTWRQIATRLGVCKTTVLRAIRLSRQG
jgi:hypothetical protein